MGVTPLADFARSSHILSRCYPHPQPFPHQGGKGA